LKNPLAQAVLDSTSVDKKSFTSLDKEDQKRAINNLQKDGKLGWNDSEYLREALEASLARARGDYDEYLEQKFLLEWDPAALESNSDSDYEKGTGEAKNHPRDKAEGRDVEMHDMGATSDVVSSDRKCERDSEDNHGST
jgi:hypothetical protein